MLVRLMKRLSGKQRGTYGKCTVDVCLGPSKAIGGQLLAERINDNRPELLVAVAEYHQGYIQLSYLTSNMLSPRNGDPKLTARREGGPRG